MKVCLAGTYSREKHPEIVEAFWRSPFILESFFYIKKWQTELLQSRELFLLDSGAFSFINTGKRVDWEAFVDRYAGFVREHQVKHYFELDIDQIIGVNPTRRLREKLESKVGWQSIPVWHNIRGRQQLVQMCKDYEYASTSLSGFTNTSRWFRKHKYRPLTEMLRIAKEHGCKIHGLGFTNTPMLHKFSSLYSVDSTSWLSGSRFGNRHLFQGGLIKQQPPKQNKKGKGLAICDLHNVQQWLKFQAYAEVELG